MKSHTWKKIESEFNVESDADNFRSAKTLKTKYGNMKKNTKEKVATNKFKRKKTGGGSYSPIPYNQLDNMILEITDKNTMGYAKSNYDNDNYDDGKNGSL